MSKETHLKRFLLTKDRAILASVSLIICNGLMHTYNVFIFLPSLWIKKIETGTTEKVDNWSKFLQLQFSLNHHSP